MVALLASRPAAPAQEAWHFEYASGNPVRLVWSTVPGQTYDLRQSTNLSAWAQAAGFPKTATGASMDYSFAPGPLGFFWIGTVTTGGGWQLQRLPSGAALELAAVSALDSNQVWACGSTLPERDVCVLRSTNGGAAWAVAYRAANVGFFGELQMITPSVGFAAGQGLKRTTDGGLTWEIEQNNLPNPPGVYHSVGPEVYVYGLAAVDQDHLWTAGWDGAGAGVIYHRVPERPQPDPANPNPNTPWWLEWAQNSRAMYGVSAVNPSTAWAVGYAGWIWKTTDGAGWFQQDSGTAVALNDVAAVSTHTAWAVGEAGTILNTTDGGTTWVAQVSGVTESLKRISAVDSNIAWVVGGSGTILKTTNGGAVWFRQLSGTFATLLGVKAIDASTAWIVGADNTALHTTDGGAGAWPAPAISGVTPDLAGASSWPPMTLTVSGTGFRGGNLSAWFGDTQANATWIDTTTLAVVAPSGLAGVFDLRVVNEDGQSATLSNAVSFLPAPILTRYHPLHGPAAGGYDITVDGFNLESVTHAEFYSTVSQETYPLEVRVIDSTRVIVTAPAAAGRTPGPAYLILKTAQNQSAGANEFLLEPAEGAAFAIDSITPASGPAGIAVTVTGTGFSPTASLQMCGRALNITNRSSTRLIAQAAGDYPGLCAVYLGNDETTGITVEPGFHLIAGPGPTISQIGPVSGPPAGGTTVTIAGAGFSSSDTVTFGGRVAAIATLNATSIVVKTPPRPAGPVSVIVMPQDLERPAAVLTNGFLYTTAP